MNATFKTFAAGFLAALFATMQLAGQWLHLLGAGQCEHFHGYAHLGHCPLDVANHDARDASYPHARHVCCSGHRHNPAGQSRRDAASHGVRGTNRASVANNSSKESSSAVDGPALTSLPPRSHGICPVCDYFSITLKASPAVQVDSSPDPLGLLELRAGLKHRSSAAPPSARGPPAC
jgi:hypothetical protein